MHGSWGARSLTWDDLCALEHDEEVARSRPKALAASHEELPSPSPCTGRAADLAACEEATAEKRYMTGCNALGAC